MNPEPPIDQDHISELSMQDQRIAGQHQFNLQRVRETHLPDELGQAQQKRPSKYKNLRKERARNVWDRDYLENEMKILYVFWFVIAKIFDYFAYLYEELKGQ